MGLPQIIIDFKTKGVSAISRSKRGDAALVFTKDGLLEPFGKTYKNAEECTDLEGETKTFAELCFSQSPKSVTVFILPETEGKASLSSHEKFLEGFDYNWIGFCTDALEGGNIAAFVKKMRDKGRYIKAVSHLDYAFDSEAVVALGGAEVTLTSVSGGAKCLVPLITGCAAAAALGESLTYKRLTAVTGYTLSGEENDLIEDGKLVLIRDEQGYKIARGINSLVSDSGSGEFKKIKIIETMDTIRADIKSSLESSYIGRVKNDYDSKLLLCAAISGYLEGLGDSVIDSSYKNYVGVSLEMQRQYLTEHGIDTENMSDTEILKANTGSSVFLEAKVRFVDAMEDIVFTLEM